MKSIMRAYCLSGVCFCLCLFSSPLQGDDFKPLDANALQVQLNSHSSLRGASIKVVSTGKGTMALRGRVISRTQKARALEIARKLRPTVPFSNELVVQTTAERDGNATIETLIQKGKYEHHRRQPVVKSKLDIQILPLQVALSPSQSKSYHGKQRRVLVLPLQVVNRSQQTIEAAIAHEWFGGQWPSTDLHVYMASVYTSYKPAIRPVFLVGEKGSSVKPTILRPGESTQLNLRMDWPGTGSVRGGTLMELDKPATYGLRAVLFFKSKEQTLKSKEQKQYVISPKMRIQVVQKPVVTQPVKPARVQTPLSLLEAVGPSLAHDPLQTWTPSPAFTEGKLVYIARIRDPKAPMKGQFLELREFGNQAEQPVTVRVYRVNEIWDHAFDPQFSPDGQYVLFKLGWPFDAQGTWSLVLWNLQTGDAHLGPSDRLSYSQVRWSPNGKCLAYIAGRVNDGRLDDKQQSPQLTIYHLETKKYHRVTTGNAAPTFAWTPQNTLLFSDFTQPMTPRRTLSNREDVKKTRNGVASTAGALPNPKLPVRPDIYEVAADGSRRRLVIRSGFNAAQSPDGRWIAYLGWVDPLPGEVANQQSGDDWPLEDVWPSLHLYDKAEAKSYIIGKFKTDSLLWTRDSRHVIGGTQSIDDVDVATKVMRRVALLREDFKPVDGIYRSTFQPSGISLDSHYLFVKTSEVVGSEGPYWAQIASVKAVDLRNGEISNLAQVKTRMGMDWWSPRTAGAATLDPGKPQ